MNKHLLVEASDSARPLTAPASSPQLLSNNFLQRNKPPVRPYHVPASEIGTAQCNVAPTFSNLQVKRWYGKKYSFQYQAPSTPAGRTVKNSTKNIMANFSPHFCMEARAVLPDWKRRDLASKAPLQETPKRRSAVIYQMGTSASVPASYYIKTPCRDERFYQYSIALSTTVGLKETT